jgi:hypothetical protein
VDPQRRSSWSVFNNTPQIVPDSPPLVRKQSKLLLAESPIDAPPTAGNQQTSSLETPSDSPDEVLHFIYVNKIF